MTHERQLRSLSDDELLRRLSELLGQSRRVESELIAHIGEVEERRLYAREASRSMFAYCTEVLNLSEHEAYLRVAVARASRKHPVLLSMLRDGRLHLSGIAVLAPHLTPQNRERVLERATGKSKRQIEELVAELAPKPEVRGMMRKLPRPSRAKKAPEPRQGRIRAPLLGPGRVTPVPQPAKRPAVVEPLAPTRNKVRFTASAELRAKLERLQALMRSSHPDGDLAAVIEAAVTEKLERLESKRFGLTDKPRKSIEETDTFPSSRYLPTPIRRAVHQRDDGRCRFVDGRGRRCPERHDLEFHHDEAFGRGGDHSVENIRLMCPPHNAYLAQLEYGSATMDRYRRSASEVCESIAVYGVQNSRATGYAASRGGAGQQLRVQPGPRREVMRPRPVVAGPGYQRFR